MINPMPLEQPAVFHHQEDFQKQEFAETMIHIADVFKQIQILCAENKTAKTLFESADNWSMSLAQRLEFLKDLLEDDQHELAYKNTLTNQTLASLQEILTALREQVTQGDYAQVAPIKKAKETLDQLFGTKSLS